MSFLFVGEKPSRTAHQKGWSWRDGRLAAKTLFDALRSSTIAPEACAFYNLFGDHPDDPEIASPDRITHLRGSQLPLVAMGDKVSAALSEHQISHRRIVHPAARGKIRGKAVYAAHIREMLVG